MTAGYSDAEAAQAITYWLAGMTQKEINRRLKGKASATPVSLAISDFTRRFATNLPSALPRDYTYTYAQRANDAEACQAQIDFCYDRRKFAANALNNWCRAQPTKPKLRLAASWVRAA